jgi:hypothetical protein
MISKREYRSRGKSGNSGSGKPLTEFAPFYNAARTA